MILHIVTVHTSPNLGSLQSKKTVLTEDIFLGVFITLNLYCIYMPLDVCAASVDPDQLA